MAARIAVGRRVAHIGAEDDAELHQDLPVLAGISRRRDGARGRLHVTGHVRVGRVLLDEGAAGEHDVRRVEQRRVQHALHDERGDLA